VHSESVRDPHEARLTSCRVLSHDAAGLVCWGAGRVASHRLRRAGADSGKRPRRCDHPGAGVYAGKPARRSGVSDAASIGSGESTRRDDEFIANGQSNESAGVEWRPGESVHAPGGDAASTGI
jgi:hypothetical protein